MKKFILAVSISVFLLGCATTQSIENTVIEPEYPDVRVNMDIKVVGPMSPMVAPTQNEEAMRAYNTGTQLLWDNKPDEAEKYLLEAIAGSFFCRCHGSPWHGLQETEQA